MRSVPPSSSGPCSFPAVTDMVGGGLPAEARPVDRRHLDGALPRRHADRRQGAARQEGAARKVPALVEIRRELLHRRMFRHRQHDPQGRSPGTTAPACSRTTRRKGGEWQRLADASRCRSAVCGKDRWITARLATQQSIGTHASQTVLRVCGQTAWLLADLIDGRKIRLEDWGGQYGIVGWPSAVPRDTLRDREHRLCRRYVPGRLWSVIKTNSFRDAVLLAVNLGDDADTVGAITSRIAGALYGLNAIPVDWRRKLAWTQKLHEKAEQLWA